MKLMKPAHVKHIVIHCSATPPKMDIGVDEIDMWHRKKGWLMVGYHRVIRRNGVVEFGRLLTNEGAQYGAHVGIPLNYSSIGICLIGGMDKDMKHAENNFTPEQFSALEDEIKELKDMGYAHCEILGHRDLPRVTKDCPSFDVREWLRSRGFIE